MPHITIEYSANVADHHDIADLVDAVHEAALETGLPPKAGLRTRATRRNHYKIADGDPRYAFIAIAARIGPGRDEPTKTTFLTQVLSAATSHLNNTDPDSPLILAWSIELTEIDANFRINQNDIRTHIQERES